MIQVLTLDNLSLSRHFFENSTLWGASSFMTGYDFCHMLNVSLRLQLIRRIDFDLIVYKPANLIPKTIDLFSSHVEQQEGPDQAFFPVFHQQLPLSETEVFVYTNRYNGNYLVPEHKNIDYFILIKNGNYFDHLKSVDRYINDFKNVSFCKKIPINDQRWLENLIL